MKTRVVNGLYILFGILCGLVAGSILDRGTDLFLTKALSVGALMFIGLRGRWIESRMHQKYVENWGEVRTRGKWWFVLARYAFPRWVVLLVIVVGLQWKFTAASMDILETLEFTGALLVPVLLYMGHLEWHESEREHEIRTIRDAAEYISLKQN